MRFARILFCSVSVLLVLSSCCALERHSLNYNFRLLAQAERFETGRIYESGESSKTAAAFAALLRSPNASVIFSNLFNESQNDVGKTYALLGLHEVDEKLFNEFLPKLNPESRIPVLWFGVIQDQTVAQMVEKIRDGELISAVQWK